MQRLTRLTLILPLSLSLLACAEEASTSPDDVMAPREDPALWNQSFVEMEELKGDTSTCSGVVVPDQSGFNRFVTFTFDDGPSLSTTPQLLEILRRHEVPATFFVNRVEGEARLALLEEMVADPLFTVGNHTWSHPNMKLQDEARVISEIDKVTALIEGAGGAPSFFRFPYGSSSCMSADKVRERGYKITGWHIDSADWCYKAGGGYCKASTFQHVPDAFRGSMSDWTMHQVRQREGGVLLFHDIHQTTIDAIEPLILKLKEEGYQFTHLGDKAVFPLLNNVALSFIGDPCAAEGDCTSGQFCHEAGFCTQACEGYCPDLAGKAPTFCAEDPLAPTTGICVSKAHEINGDCADLEVTLDLVTPRFIGESGAAAVEAKVCLPNAEMISARAEADADQPTE
ncbi:polysaccharide deacetylase family protein [Myxococcota bacterium]|nr:polysaccharide deacetylase family protein [Myxococcota bacterium]MBU1433170.1 polysaccharide deacetylase family protein [Myxococcota bacterium]MBU1899719.1 polysaccharide deacetylase family protein [Myxococcota bacterium]